MLPCQSQRNREQLPVQPSVIIGRFNPLYKFKITLNPLGFFHLNLLSLISRMIVIPFIETRRISSQTINTINSFSAYRSF